MTAAGLAQSLERLTAERVVVGSIPRVRPILRVLGCVRGGNTDLDFQNLNPDFPIEREIRKRISPPRNPSSGWISIKKSKSGFFGFPFLSFDWEIRKRIY